MNGDPRHPGTEELAEFRAGVTDGACGDRLAAHLAECPDCASASERLDQIPAMLASIPTPVMPGYVETRIAGVLAAEAARRNSAATVVPVPSLFPQLISGTASASLESGSPALSSDRAKARRRGRRRSHAAATLGGLVAAAACLGLAFAGLRLSDTGHPASSAAARNNPVHVGQNTPVSAAPGMHHDNLSPAHNPPAGTVPFVVLVSSTDFRQSTLRAQVMRQFSAAASAGPSGRPGPVAGRGARISPSRSLVGCVLHVTRHGIPAFVEEATYEYRPVYVIAVPGRAWVVARDCTSANPAVLASVALPPRP